jgi:hypothetical protein
MVRVPAARVRFRIRTNQICSHLWCLTGTLTDVSNRPSTRDDDVMSSMHSNHLMHTCSLHRAFSCASHFRVCVCRSACTRRVFLEHDWVHKQSSTPWHHPLNGLRIFSITLFLCSVTCTHFFKTCVCVCVYNMCYVWRPRCSMSWGLTSLSLQCNENIPSSVLNRLIKEVKEYTKVHAILLLRLLALLVQKYKYWHLRSPAGAGVWHQAANQWRKLHRPPRWDFGAWSVLLALLQQKYKYWHLRTSTLRFRCLVCKERKILLEPPPIHIYRCMYIYMYVCNSLTKEGSSPESTSYVSMLVRLSPCMGSVVHWEQVGCFKCLTSVLVLLY